MREDRYHVFVYGSLLKPVVLDRVLGHAYEGERLRSRLRGFQRVQVAEYAYPFLVPAEGAHTDGVLVMDLSGQDLHALDGYEGTGEGEYERWPVEVEVWGCGPSSSRVPAFTYVGGPGLRQAWERR